MDAKTKNVAHRGFRKSSLFFLMGFLALFIVLLSGVQSWAGSGPTVEINQLSSAAEQGDANAQYNLGVLYDDGKGTPQDYKKAAFWYRKAAEQGNDQAQNRLGVFYELGSGVPQDDTKAAFWYRKAAEQGNASAQISLGSHYELGEGVPQDYTKAAFWYRKAAEQGDAQAQTKLGILYDDGKGVPQDYQKAASWYRKAADQGDPNAQFDLGNLYVNGQGVPKDYTQAAFWYRKAADQGYDLAQFNLGIAYVNGQGVPKDYTQAAFWYRKAADQGYDLAQFNLGFFYYNGKGIPQDYQKAAFWFRKAADQGNAQAQNNLGVLYDNGQGVPQNHTKAAFWYRKAADQGDASAQNSLGFLYYNGQGVPQSYSKAVFWFRKAAAQGDVNAQNNLKILEAKINNQNNSADSQASSSPSPWISSDEAKQIAQQAAQQAVEETQSKYDQKILSLTKALPEKKRASPSALGFHSLVDRPSFERPANRRLYAVVIGVEHYPKPLPPATYAVRDATAIRRTLLALGVPPDHLKTLTDDKASIGRIKAALAWLKRNVRPGSTVWVYFSGHGSPSDKGAAYLVPFDGDPSDLSDTGYRVSDFYRQLSRLPARHIIVALDACFTGEGDRSVVGAVRPLVTTIREGGIPSSGKLIAFTAARSDQESGVLETQGHGMFTYYFLRGLDGKALHSGHVTVKDLGGVVKWRPGSPFPKRIKIRHQIRCNSRRA